MRVHLCRVAGNTVTLCDPIWQVTSRSCEMGFPRRAISAFTFTFTFIQQHMLRHAINTRKLSYRKYDRALRVSVNVTHSNDLLHFKNISQCVTYSRKYRLGNKYFLTSTSTSTSTSGPSTSTTTHVQQDCSVQQAY